MALVMAILKESQVGERRVALTPAIISRLKRLGIEIRIEESAGRSATFEDTAYADCRIEADRQSLLKAADIVLAVQPPSITSVEAMKPGTTLLSFVHGGNSPTLVRVLRDRKITSIAMELIPRISRAQAMDALSSQAALAGYYAPLLGAVHMPRILPMMTTAVGSLRAARVLVMGLGVAGLQALATAHRLGAITEGYDVRPETREQALSLGAKFVETGVDGSGEGGYARVLTAEERAKVQAALDKYIAEADLIITTASVPGRAAPKLISAVQVASMKAGAVIVDPGAEGGGNCEASRPGETTAVGSVTILAPLNVPSMLAQHASELYAKNLANVVELIVKDGAIHLDFDDDIVAATVLTHEGQIRDPKIRAAVLATDAEEKAA